MPIKRIFTYVLYYCVYYDFFFMKQKLHISRNVLRPDILVKFIYSEKATKFCEILPLLLTTVHAVKSKGKIT